MAQSRLRCPVCGGNHVVKSGKRYGAYYVTQTYRCQDCGTGFSNPGHFREKIRERVPSAVKQYAINLYIQGLSLRRVSERLKKDLGISVSATSVFKWLRRANVPTRPRIYRKTN